MTPLQQRDPRTRNVAVRRLFGLLSLLAHSPRCLEEMATEMGCTTRTIRRDLAILEEVHVPIARYGPYYRLDGPMPYVRQRESA